MGGRLAQSSEMVDMIGLQWCCIVGGRAQLQERDPMRTDPVSGQRYYTKAPTNAYGNEMPALDQLCSRRTNVTVYRQTTELSYTPLHEVNVHWAQLQTGNRASCH